MIYGRGTFDDVHDPRTKVRGLQKGRNTLQWKITYNSGYSADTVQIWNMSVTEAYAGSDRTICSSEYEMQGNQAKDDDYVIVKANGTKSIVKSSQLWQLISGGCDFAKQSTKYLNVPGNYSNRPDTIHNVMVQNLKQGENTLVYKIYNILDGDELCSSTDTIIIKNDMADQALAHPDHAVYLDQNSGRLGPIPEDERTIVYTCDGTARLYPNTPSYGKGQWIVASGSSAKFDDNDAYDVGAGRNTLIWRISTESGGECNSEDYIYVQNNKPSDADAGYDAPFPICGQIAQLSGNKPTEYSQAYWELVEGGGKFVVPGTEDSNPILTNRVELRKDENGESQWYYDEDGNEHKMTTVGEAQNLQVRDLAFGNNKFRWVIKYGQGNNVCESSDEAILNNIYIKAVAGRVSPQCTDTVMLTANNPSPGVGQWSIAAGMGRGSFEDQYNPHTVVRNLGNGRNTLVWTVNYLECPSTDTVVVINNSATEAHIDGGLQQLCDTNVTIITAGPLAIDKTGEWYEEGVWEIAEGGGDILYPHQTSTIVKDIPFNKDGNRYRWTVTRVFNYEGNEFKCISMDDVTVEYNKVRARAGEDQELCSDHTILQAQSAGIAQGKWSLVGASGSGTFDNMLDPTTAIRNLGMGPNILRWTTAYKGCEDFDEVIITNGMPSIPYAGQPQPTCDDFITLAAHKPEFGQGEWSTIAGYANWTEQNKYDPVAYLDSIGKGDNTYRWTVTQNTPLYRGLDINGNAMYDTLRCSLSDDVTIHNNKPSAPYAGKDATVCQDSCQLKAVVPSYGEGIWTIVEVGGGKIESPTEPTTTVKNLAYGKTKFRWTVSVDGMCPEYDEIVMRNYSPTKSDAGADIEDCSNSQYLDANSPAIGKGHWEIISGSHNTVSSMDENGNTVTLPSFDNETDPKTEVRNLIFGQNKFLWVIENIVTSDGETFRCQSVDTVNVWNMIPDQADARDDRVLCKDYTVMNGNVPSIGVGTWRLLQGEGEIVEPNNPKTAVKGLGYGENIFRWTIKYGECVTEDDVKVISQKADPYAGENDVTYVDTYQLNAGNPGRLPGYWTYLGVSDDIVFADSSDYHTTVKGLARGINTFRWTIDTEDCHVFDEVSITYKVVPEAGFTADTLQGCSPLTVRFSDASLDAREFNWDFGDGTTSIIRNPVHTFTLPGNYEVSLTVPGPDGKKSKYTQFVRVYGHPLSSFDAAPQLVFLPDDKVHFVNKSINADKFLWSFGDGNTSEEKNPTYQYDHEGMYTVTLTVWNEYGCDADTTKESFVEARQGGFIVFPNTFAPRETTTGNVSIYGINSTFRPVYQDVETFHMQIFNRWGQLIFETDDINLGWDGRFNGSLAAEGLYVWIAKGKFASGKEYNMSGQVLIIK